jgi:hypothetical protein
LSTSSGCGAALTFGTAKLCFSMEKWRFAKFAVLPIWLRAAYSFAVAAKSNVLRRIVGGRIAEGINTTLGRRNHKNRPEAKISDVLPKPREDHDEQRPTQQPDQAI